MPKIYLTQAERERAAEEDRQEIRIGMVKKAMIDRRINSFSDLADKMDIDVKTLRKKLKTPMLFYVGEVHKLSNILNLTDDETYFIFYNDKLPQNSRR